MRFYALVFFVLVIVPIVILIRRALRRERREKLKMLPFPDEWLKIVEKNIPLYKYLPDNLKKDLQGYIQIFIAEKGFEGCGGLEVTDEIKVTIAAQACFILLNRGEPTYYPELVSIVVYPSAYIATQKAARGSEIVEEDSVRLGESWTLGTVVLAWDNVKKGTREFKSGQNVVIHEFAHQLDQEDGAADGAPILEKSENYVTWARVLSKEYEVLQKKAKRHKKSVMDYYGATDPAEFFAVATETFFEKGKKLKRTHPELYEELQSYYKMDPAEWF